MAEVATEKGWAAWLDEHAPRFLLFARQKSRCEEDAEDLVQEAIMEAGGRNHDGQPPAPGLVFSIIHRRAIDLARRNERRTEREIRALGADQEAWFDNEVESAELRQAVSAALSQLPEEQREVVTLKTWGELTFAEIGQVLGISQNTAASRYRLGLDALRKLTRGVVV